MQEIATRQLLRTTRDQLRLLVQARDPRALAALVLMGVPHPQELRLLAGKLGRHVAARLGFDVLRAHAPAAVQLP